MCERCLAGHGLSTGAKLTGDALAMPCLAMTQSDIAALT